MGHCASSNSLKCVVLIGGHAAAGICTYNDAGVPRLAPSASPIKPKTHQASPKRLSTYVGRRLAALISLNKVVCTNAKWLLVIDRFILGGGSLMDNIRCAPLLGWAGWPVG